MIDRREFLARCAAAAGTTLLLESWPIRFALAAGTAPKRRPIVLIFQRGACDGLSLLPPLRDENYSKFRPQIAIPKEDTLALTADFGLHPGCAAFAPFWKSGQLAFLPLSGSPAPTRSHFDAQDYMEIGTPGVKRTQDGFLNRALAESTSHSPLRAMALQSALPRSLQGESPALATGSLKDFQLHGVFKQSTLVNGFEGMYEQAVNESLRGVSEETFSALRTVETLLKSEKPVTGFPPTKLGKALQDIALLIHSNVGLELAVTEMSGWDSHVNQGTAKGSLSKRFVEWSEAIAAFAHNLGPRLNEVLLVSVTEFGRTVKQNGSGGTDHGHGSTFTFLGGGIRGGLHGDSFRLHENELFEGRDLPVKHDFRDTFSALLEHQWGLRDFTKIFPGHKANPRAPKLFG